MKTEESSSAARLKAYLPLVVVLAIAGGAAYFAFRPPPREPVAPPPPPDIRKLIGRWARNDANYILEVTEVDRDGRAKVAYLNPRPINVSKAEAAVKDGAAALFVELRDQGYPGSTYTLRLDPARDALVGVYFQAAQRQSFEVEFVRAK